MAMNLTNLVYSQRVKSLIKGRDDYLRKLTSENTYIKLSNCGRSFVSLKSIINNGAYIVLAFTCANSRRANLFTKLMLETVNSSDYDTYSAVIFAGKDEEMTRWLRKFTFKYRTAGNARIYSVDANSLKYLLYICINYPKKFYELRAKYIKFREIHKNILEFPAMLGDIIN